MTTSATDDTAPLIGTGAAAPLTGTQGNAPMIGMTAPDRCSSCGSEMAPDQRYCVECGNRRGKPRFGLAAPASAAAPAAAEPAPRHFSSSATLLLGLAILILALGTGVLIGNTGSSNASNLTGKPYKITINNGAGGVAGAGTTAASSGTKSSGKSTSSSGTKTANLSGKNTSSVNIKSLHTKAQKKAALTKQSNQSIKLANGKAIGPEKLKIGDPCSDNVVGCVNGKYTGSYFGNN